jgi:hypothetical protein
MSKRKTLRSNNGLLLVLASVLCVLGLGLNAYLLSFGVSDYPLAITWSESGRIFNAFQVYAPLLTGQQYPLPWLDPGRAVLDGLVLLLPGIQLWIWRLWVALLSFVLPLVVAGLMVRQAFHGSKTSSETRVDRWKQFLLVAYGAIFLFQGPIYSHLLLAVIPVLVFFKPDRPWRNLIVVMLSGLWSGLTRANWFVMPALTAVALYLLQTPVAGKKFWAYIRMPAIWGLGNALVSIGVYAMATWLSGMPSILTPGMDYAFIKAKLLPNMGYSLGLAPGIMLVSLPLVALIIAVIWQNPRRFGWVRKLLLVGILTVLGIGSTVISLRSGGGYDLHNYDTYLYMLLLIALPVGLEELDENRNEDNPAGHIPLKNPALLIGLLLIPLILLGSKIREYPQRPHNKALAVIEEVGHVLQQPASETKPEILIIDYRHLGLFGYLDIEEFYPAYEKIELMEMAMARNDEYFLEFSDKITRQSFSLIVSEVLWVGERLPEQNPYWYENNMWVNYVANPILEHYEPILINRTLGVAIYAPISNSSP